MYNYQCVNNLYFKEDELNILKFIDSFRYINDRFKKGDNSIPLPELARILQNSMRELLYIFFANPFSFSGHFFSFPILIERYYKKKFLELFPLAASIHKISGGMERFYYGLKDIANGRADETPLSYATLFSLYYSEFSEIVKHLAIEQKVIKEKCYSFQPDKLHEAEREKNYLKPLFILQASGAKKLKPYLKGFYLHGSFSTNDFVKNWSDIDTFIIINKETIMNPRHLLILQRELYSMTGIFYWTDPFQSHGFFVIAEQDMSWYPQTYFPLELFKYSKSFFEEDSAMEFLTRDYRAEGIESFWKDELHFIRKMKMERGGMLSNNDIRMLLHKIYNFPLFYLQARGIHCYKKYAFEKAKADFTDEEWLPITDAGRVWASWSADYIHRVLPIEAFYLSPYVLEKFLKLLLNRKRDLFFRYSIDYEKLLDDTLALMEKAWVRLRSDFCAI